MHNHDIDKTIENIDDALEENALPKAAPTQLTLNSPPEGIPITALHVSHLSDVLLQRILKDIIKCITNIPRDCGEFERYTIITELPQGFYFTLQCTECEFMHYDTECPLQPAVLHVDNYNHIVEFCIHAGERKIATVLALPMPPLPMPPAIPEKPSFWQRVYNFYSWLKRDKR